MRRTLRHEMLERRELFAADFVGIARGANQILLNIDNDPAHEIDLSYGVAGDKHLAGDWNGTGQDHQGVVRNGADGFKRWYLDTNNDPLHEIDYLFGLNGDTPVVGDWDGVGGDNVGVARNGQDGLIHWYLDTNSDPLPEMEFAFGLNGDTPVTGDWNGDGKTDIGVVRNGADGVMRWYLNWDGNVWAEDEYAFGLNGDRPVVGDWNGDGRDDIGAVRTNQWGFLNWYLNTDRDTMPEQQIDFGARNDTPLVGKWSSPEVAVSTTTLQFGSTAQGSKSPVQEVTITNEGNAALTMSVAQLPVGFQFVTAPPSEVSPGGKATFSIGMQTESLGAHSGHLTITTNDGNESRVDILLSGWVGAHTLVGKPISNLPANNGDVGGTPSGGVQPAVNNGNATPTPSTPPQIVIDMLIKPQPAGPQIVTSGPTTNRPTTPDLDVSFSGRYVKDGKIDFNGIVVGDNPTQTIIVSNRGQQDLVISNLKLVPGYKIVGIRDGQRIASGGHITVSITPDGSLGEKLGTLRFTTNDVQDGAFAVDLRAKRFPANQPGFPIMNINWVRDKIVEDEYLTSDALRIEITPAYGRTTVGTAYLITVHTKSGSNTWQYSGRLTRLRLLGVNTHSIPVENWTSIKVDQV
ncbi:MAG: choice-of-anchor D domain-containing protein [Planctomycetaceae bacterium]|nr:choice-of-anchor D domain-containing protein [Planctomycetaceae bacterium]